MSTGHFNNVYLLDPNKNIWRLFETESKPPRPRSYFAYWFDPPYFFVHGGRGENQVIYSDMYFINMNNSIWKRAFILDFPLQR